MNFNHTEMDNQKILVNFVHGYNDDDITFTQIP